MMRKAVLVTITLIAALVLAACSAPELSDYELNFELGESHTLGYEVDDSGKITIEERIMTFRNAPGAKPMTITGYEVSYYDGNGTEISTKSTADQQPFSRAIFVPAGLTCDAPDPEGGCSILDAGARVGPSPLVQAPHAGNLLPVEIAEMHLMMSMTNPTAAVKWSAEFVFHGYRDRGEFVTRPYRVHIVAPN